MPQRRLHADVPLRGQRLRSDDVLRQFRPGARLRAVEADRAVLDHLLAPGAVASRDLAREAAHEHRLRAGRHVVGEEWERWKSAGGCVCRAGGGRPRPVINAGQLISVIGWWINDRGHGLQSKAIHVVPIQPTTAALPRSALGSGPGVQRDGVRPDRAGAGACAPHADVHADEAARRVGIGPGGCGVRDRRCWAG